MKIVKYAEIYKGEVYNLFVKTILNVNCKDYNKKQVEAWVSNTDSEKFNNSLLDSYSIVCIENEKVIGFGDITKDGYLDRLYVHKDYIRTGVGTLICDELEEVFEVNKIVVYASISAKRFFEKRGYRVISENNVVLKNVELTNYIMEKKHEKKRKRSY